MEKIILMVVGFLVLVVLLGLITAKLNGIELGKEPDEMSEKSLALYIPLRPFLFPAELVVKLFKKKK